LTLHPDEPDKKAGDDRTLNFRLILDHMPAMIGYWDRNLRNRYGNHAYKFWFGIDPETMLGKHISEVIGEERYRLNLPYIEKALAGEAQEFEREIPSPDGSVVRYSLANYIPDIVDGEVMGFYVMVSDITTLKKTKIKLQESEEKLRHSENLYRSILEEQTEIISRIRHDGTFIFVNERYCQFFQRRPEQLIGHVWYPLAHPDDRKAIEDKLNTLSIDNPMVVIENRIANGAGELRWMQFVNQGFFDEQGNLLEIQSVGRDITDRVNAEIALAKIRDELEHRVQERTADLQRLAMEATMAEEKERQAIAQDLHDDLGQYLHILRLKIDALATKNPSIEKTTVDELIALVANSSGLVRSLTSQLSPPVLKTLGLQAALEWLAEEMERQYGLAVQVQANPIKIPLTAVQSSILFRSARELLFNVVKHAQARTAFVRLEMTDGNSLMLEVEDNGIGSSCLSAEDGNPNGFGLASLRERLSFLGGSISLCTSRHGGLRVTLTLPLDMILAGTPQ